MPHAVKASASVAAKLLILPGRIKRFFTLFTQMDRGIWVGDRKGKHHLQAQQKRMEIPHDGRLVQQGYMVGGSSPFKDPHDIAQLFFRKHGIIVVVMYRQEIDDPYQVINRRNADFRKKNAFPWCLVNFTQNGFKKPLTFWKE